MMRQRNLGSPVPACTQVFVARCPDVPGIVAELATCIAANGQSISESSQFSEPIDSQFYIRLVFGPASKADPSPTKLLGDLTKTATKFGMQWELFDGAKKPRVLIAVSKFGHCLYDLLHRWKAGILPLDVVGVVSNHEDMRSFVEWSGVDFFYLPISHGEKDAQEAALIDLVDRLNVDLVVLARYMQVLSADLCQRFAGACINIHHSFLPSFKGARPYQQAHHRGVKLIGATAHYVTSNLDEGPIIEQDVERVSHAASPDDLVRVGRDVECRVLARAVRWHAERRVIINGSKTVVFG